MTNKKMNTHREEKAKLVKTQVVHPMSAKRTKLAGFNNLCKVHMTM